jgi:hypothetical protein
MMTREKNGRGGEGTLMRWAWPTLACLLAAALVQASGCLSCGGEDKGPGAGAVVEIINPDDIPLDPAQEETIRNYYQAVNNKDAESACRIRLSCSDTERDTVRNILGITLERITVLKNDSMMGEFMSEGQEAHGDGVPTAWKHFLRLTKIGGSWKIDTLSEEPLAPYQPPAAGPGPEEVMREYYRALEQKDQAAFCKVHLECTDEVKHVLTRHEGVALETISLKSSEGKTATVYTESLESFSDGSKARWKQDWLLKNMDGEWKIETTANVELVEIPPSGPVADQGPEQVVTSYYQALDKHDVDKACSLRLTCTEINKSNIRKHKPITLISAVLQSSDANRAVVHTESIEINDDGSRWRWKQDWFLELKDGKWLINTTDNASFKKEKN